MYVQSDQKENISEQALQSIGHVVAESYAMHGRGQFVVSIMELFVQNYYLIMGKIDKINNSNILHS
jgi:hypothetical protein